MREALTKLFSEFWQIDAAHIHDGLKLDDETLKSKMSIRFYQFIAAVESNLDVSVKNIEKIRTFGDLCAAVQAQ